VDGSKGFAVRQARLWDKAGLAQVIAYTPRRAALCSNLFGPNLISETEISDGLTLTKCKHMLTYSGCRTQGIMAAAATQAGQREARRARRYVCARARLLALDGSTSLRSNLTWYSSSDAAPARSQWQRPQPVHHVAS
jgi:hypothetical protein